MSSLRILLTALLFGLLIACDSTTPPPPDRPDGDGEELSFLIRNVTLEPALITVGESAVLSWEFGSERVEVEVQPLDTTVAGQDSVTVQPVVSTTYTLTARLAGYEPEVHEVTLTVLEEPDGPGGVNVTIDGSILTLDGAMLMAAAANEQGRAALLELARASNVVPDDPRVHLMDGAYFAGLASTWLLPHEGEPVTIAYLGAGIRTDHEDIGPALLQGYDFCADLTCSTTDDSVHAESERDVYPHQIATGTTHVGPLVAVSGNGVGGVSIAGPHDGAIEVLPLKVVHYEPQDLPLWPTFFGTPAAFINAMTYALGEDPGIPGLAPLDEPVDIILMTHGPGRTLTGDESETLEGLFGLAASLDVLIVTYSGLVQDAVDGQPNDFASVASHFLDNNILVVRAPDEAPHSNQDVFLAEEVTSPSDFSIDALTGEQTWGGYQASFYTETLAAGIAALQQYHHPSLRGRELHDAIIAGVCPEGVCAPGRDTRLDLALGLPGPGHEGVIELRNSRGELVQSQPFTLDASGRADYELTFEGGDAFTLQAVVHGERYTLFGATEKFEIHNGFRTLNILLDSTVLR